MTCNICYWAFQTVLEWYFCNCPARLDEFIEKYKKSEAPRGGLPQSSDHKCHRFEWTHQPIPAKLFDLMVLKEIENE